MPEAETHAAYTRAGRRALTCDLLADLAAGPQCTACCPPSAACSLSWFPSDPGMGRRALGQDLLHHRRSAEPPPTTPPRHCTRPSLPDTFKPIEIAGSYDKAVTLPDPFSALITGASSGVGAAMAKELAGPGAHLFLTARDGQRLSSVGVECEKRGARVERRICELLDDEAVSAYAAELRSSPRLDAIIHAAGAISFHPLAELPLEVLQNVFGVNFRAPFHLTKNLLPALTAVDGQVVFVSSSAVDRGQSNTGAYTASKHALRGLADVLRAEVNDDGVRVLSVYLGRTATPMQERVAHAEGAKYRPENLLRPEDVARAIHDTLRLPRTAEVTEIRLRPMRK